MLEWKKDLLKKLDIEAKNNDNICLYDLAAEYNIEDMRKSEVVALTDKFIKKYPEYKLVRIAEANMPVSHQSFFKTAFLTKSDTEEERSAKVLFTQTGTGSSTTKITLPISWIKSMNLTPENRDVTISFDGDKITIRRK